MLLRILVAAGLLCDAAYYWFRLDPILPSVFANLALTSINAILLMAILLERTTWRMNADDREVFGLFPTLTPGQFRRLRKMMTQERAEPGAVLTRQGAAVEHLMLVFTSQLMISKDGKDFPIAGPSFVGEVAFLTGETSSADVTLPDGGIVLKVEASALRQRMERIPAFNNAMVALFGTELARKVAYSVPLERAATD